MTNKQISINLPAEIIERARIVAAKKKRADGLKMTVTAQIREWVIKGAQQSNVR